MDNASKKQRIRDRDANLKGDSVPGGAQVLLAARFTVTLDEMLQERSQWSVVADLITSDQLPPQRLAEISAKYPDFAAWLMRDGATSFH